MGESTNIAWCHKTWSPWRGCTRVSEGCRFCYAEALSKRNPSVLGKWGPEGTRVVNKDWNKPLRWNAAAQKAGQRARVFPSLCDPFEDRDELIPWRAELFRLIERTPNLDWLLLTKRPEHVTRLLAIAMNDAYGVPQVHSDHAMWLENWLTGQRVPHNVWMGTSVENQDAVWRVGELVEIPAAVRFLSCEPLLGDVKFANASLWKDPAKWWGKDLHNYLHWVIVGGESGLNARPCDLAWIRSLVDQCEGGSIACFVKQLGARPFGQWEAWHDPNDIEITGIRHLHDSKGADPDEWPADLRIRQFPRTTPAEPAHA